MHQHFFRLACVVKGLQPHLAIQPAFVQARDLPASQQLFPDEGTESVTE